MRKLMTSIPVSYETRVRLEEIRNDKSIPKIHRKSWSALINAMIDELQSREEEELVDNYI